MTVSVRDRTYPTLTERRFADHEAYVVHEKARLRDDVLTELSERLTGAMHNSFDYVYGADDDLYYNGEALKPIFIRGIQKAELVAREHPQFAVELLRRHIEYKQYLAQCEIGQQDDDDPLLLIHISPTPDAVNEGVDLGAYDAQRQKIMVRVSEKVPDGLRVTSLSLDGGNRLGMQAIGGLCGVDIPDDATSEDILGMNFYIQTSDLKGESVTTIIRKKYDAAMQLQYGGTWYAGRQDGEVLHTLQFIQAQKEPVARFVDDVYALKQRYGAAYHDQPEYERLSYNILALLTQLQKTPDYAGSADQAGEAARADGVEFAKSDCPTGNNLSSQTADSALSQQGVGNQWEYGQCRVCLESGMVGACSVCRSCETADNQGVSLDGIHARALRRAAQKRRSSGQRTTPTAERRGGYSVYGGMDKFVKRFGSRAVLKTTIETGDARKDIVDKYSGIVLYEHVKQSDFSLAR